MYLMQKYYYSSTYANCRPVFIVFYFLINYSNNKAQPSLFCSPVMPVRHISEYYCLYPEF